MPRIGKRSAQALMGQRFQGSKPNGRDSARGAGRSPRARHGTPGTLAIGKIRARSLRPGRVNGHDSLVMDEY
ncbi:TPA: hypothetical protein L6B28_01985 [Pseudomonas aeruginosa]|nr:hypothetical protein [Pseudomonas aeruginosa]